MNTVALIDRLTARVAAEEEKYRHDPDHHNQPSGGGWRKTPKGWSRAKPGEKVTEEESHVIPHDQPEHRRPVIGNVPWRDDSEPIEKFLAADDGSNRKEWKYKGRQDNAGFHVNVVWHEVFNNGQKAVVKPEGGSAPPTEYRGGLDDSVTQSQREVTAYELDKVLGLGVVPPTTYSQKTFPEDKKDMASAQLFCAGKNKTQMDAAGKSMDAIVKNSLSMRISVSKIACFDVIVGSCDRHGNNLVMDEDRGEAYAIDNGLSLPKGDANSTFKSHPVKLLCGSGFYAVSLNDVIDEVSKHVEDNVLERLATVSKSDFDEVFKRRGFKKGEGEAAWKRLQRLTRKVRDRVYQPAPILPPAPLPQPVPAPKPVLPPSPPPKPLPPPPPLPVKPINKPQKVKVPVKPKPKLQPKRKQDWKHDQTVEIKDVVSRELLMVAREVLSIKDKDHYRYDPGHRQKPYGPGWRPTSSGWSKPRPGSNTVPAPITEPITQYTRPGGVLRALPVQPPPQPAVASELLKIATELLDE